MIIIYSPDYYRIKIPLSYHGRYLQLNINNEKWITAWYRLGRSSKYPTYTPPSQAKPPQQDISSRQIWHMFWRKSPSPTNGWGWQIGNGGRWSLKTIWFTVMFSFVRSPWIQTGLSDSDTVSFGLSIQLQRGLILCWGWDFVGKCRNKLWGKVKDAILILYC